MKKLLVFPFLTLLLLAACQKDSIVEPVDPTGADQAKLLSFLELTYHNQSRDTILFHYTAQRSVGTISIWPV